MQRLLLLLTIRLFAGSSFAADAQTAAAATALVKQPPPTTANLAYGPHPREILDFWQAKSDRPTPLVVNIHGGGWVAGDKTRVLGLEQYLAAGISVVSINYRYVTQAIDAGVKPPVQWPIEDAVRALQFVRSKARDPQQMVEWTPNSRYGGHAFGFAAGPNYPDKSPEAEFARFLAGREQVLPWIRQYSPIEHVTSDDPPIYLIYTAAPSMGQPAPDPTHSANFGVKLQEKLCSVGVDCELVYPGAPDVKHSQIADYLIDRLKAPARN